MRSVIRGVYERRVRKKKKSKWKKKEVILYQIDL